MKGAKRLTVVFDRILDLLAFLVGSITIFMMIIVCVNVAMRHFFNRPIVGVEEVTEQLLLFITFLGAAWVLRKEGHVAVDFIVVMLSSRTQAFLGIVSSLLGVIICAALTWYGLKVTWVNFQSEAYFSTLLQLPKAPIFVIIPIGSLLLLIQFVRRTAKNVASLKSPNGVDESLKKSQGV
jgi:C4-dicarboxylate transporter, DctQ subunit